MSINNESVCRNCLLPQRLHALERCLYTPTTFTPILCVKCRGINLLSWPVGDEVPRSYADELAHCVSCLLR